MKRIIVLIFCLILLTGCISPDERALNAIDNYEETNEKEVLVIFLPNGEFISYPINKFISWDSYIVFTTSNSGEKITVSHEMDWVLVSEDFYYNQMVKDLKDCENCGRKMEGDKDE